MPAIHTRPLHTHNLCRIRQFGSAIHDVQRSFRTSAVSSSPPATDGKDKPSTRSEDEETGAMSRKLEQMTEESLENSGARAGKTVEEAGFSDELKKRLEARILDANFRNENVQAFAAASMSSSAGKGSGDIASGSPWFGEEASADTALRMLDDAHKPLRPSLRSRMIIQNPIDIRPRNMQLEDRGTRLANARDKTSIYALSQDKSMTDSERETIRNRLRERFQPSSRSVPASVQGLQNLASRRIEDAIARGQFKNIPRGKGVLIERDHNADSPFIDTTEYFMNKIIKKQDLTPPWIEKQAEIHRTATMFRGRLRADWKRHAARVIASKGGSFDGQIARARAYAKAETIYNPTTKPTEDLTKSLQEISKEDSDIEALPSTTDTALTNESTLPPFRDSAWSSLELSYHTMAIKELNNLTRSYNLMAPELAKKPYFNLERELKACYAEVAPQLADEIRNRALAPKAKIEIIGHAPGGLLEKFAIGETAKVADDRRKAYGFREFWRDLFAWKE